MKGKIYTSVLSNWVGYAIQILTTLVMTPCLIAYLGTERYSLWLFITGLTGYYGILDAGVRNAVIYFVAKYNSTHDSSAVQKTIETAVALLSCSVAVGSVIVVALAYFLADYLQLLSTSRLEVKYAILIAGIGYLIQLPLMIGTASLVAVQRQDIR